jgi:hypothetical protein
VAAVVVGTTEHTHSQQQVVLAVVELLTSLELEHKLVQQEHLDRVMMEEVTIELQHMLQAVEAVLVQMATTTLAFPQVLVA